MKKLLVVLLLVSVAANAALLIKHSTRLPPVPERSIGAARSTEASQTKLPDLTAALASGDASILAAAGFSADDIRSFKLGRTALKYFDAMRGILGKDSAGKYWQNQSFNYSRMNPQQRLAMSQASRALADGMRAVYGDDMPPGMNGGNRLSYLPADKQDKIRQIQRDYDDMTAEISAQSNGLVLASDKAKLKLLEQEKDRDITAAMSPAERAEYELQSSPTANTVRNRYGDALQSEDDYKKVFALQKAFDDQYGDAATGGTLTPEQRQAQSAAQSQLAKDVLAAVGPDNYAAYRKSNDSDYQALTALDTRLNLPAATADQIYSSRDTYATQSQQIASNPDLTAQQRRDQYAAIVVQAKADLVSKLGQEAADAYTARSDWLRMLSAGNAISTDPSDDPGGMFNRNNSTVYLYRPKRKPAGP